MIIKPILLRHSTSRYLEDLLNIDNPYFEGMVNQIYPSELQLNKANTADTEAPFLDSHLSISNGFVSSKIYDKRDDSNISIHLTKTCIRLPIDMPIKCHFSHTLVGCTSIYAIS